MIKSTRSGNSMDGAGLLRSAISATLALALAAGVVACGGGGGSDDDLTHALGSTGLQRSATSPADGPPGDAEAAQPADAPSSHQ